ncbi:hypothetical protein FOL46_005367 [Perkinsus olseni]|uniref:AP-1 complex subunit sigma-1A n=2 Tax=Perkinsus olseni TaxID=32597 RepID=A0A7J6LSK4_PEROL|nr:hypothetical protein FOL46_005367 [Perkinsus olseni]
MSEHSLGPHDLTPNPGPLSSNSECTSASNPACSEGHTAAPKCHWRRVPCLLLLVAISFVPGYLLSTLRAERPLLRLSIDPSNYRSWETAPTTVIERINRGKPRDLRIMKCPSMDGELDMSYYRNGDFFQRAIADTPAKPLMVYERAREVCDGPRSDELDPGQSSRSHWKHCLPLHPNRNQSECAAATRSSLLDPRVLKPVCASAVLDMLTVDVYRAMEEVGCQSMLTFGTALGAVRNGTHVPWTEDADLAYVTSSNASPCVERKEFAGLLRSRGYFAFKHDIWRVCIGSHHPLAGQLYNIDTSIKKNKSRLCGVYGCIYVDLYAVSEAGGPRLGYYHEAHHISGFFIPSEKVFPAGSASLNGMAFATYHDVDWFLSRSYGKDYAKPKSRSQWTEDMEREKLDGQHTILTLEN